MSDEQRRQAHELVALLDSWCRANGDPHSAVCNDLTNHLASLAAERERLSGERDAAKAELEVELVRTRGTLRQEIAATKAALAKIREHLEWFLLHADDAFPIHAALARADLADLDARVTI